MGIAGNIANILQSAGAAPTGPLGIEGMPGTITPVPATLADLLNGTPPGPWEAQPSDRNWNGTWVECADGQPASWWGNPDVDGNRAWAYGVGPGPV